MKTEEHPLHELLLPEDPRPFAQGDDYILTMEVSATGNGQARLGLMTSASWREGDVDHEPGDRTPGEEDIASASVLESRYPTHPSGRPVARILDHSVAVDSIARFVRSARSVDCSSCWYRLADFLDLPYKTPLSNSIGALRRRCLVASARPRVSGKSI